jgi:hypothetical protein
MDLTLEKILLYLEDRLSPAEVKEFSLFLQQHPEAQGLLHRVEKHLRIRSVPADEALPDAQLVAAYLDGVLSPEAVADLERKTLQDDLLLHELAASHYCHSTAPQTRKGREWAEAEGIDWERMRNLVKGGKDRPKRRPAEGAVENRTADRRGARLRINRNHVLVGACALLLLVASVTGLVLRPRPGQKRDGVPEVDRVALIGTGRGREGGEESGQPEVVPPEAGEPKFVAPTVPQPMPVPAPMPIPQPMPMPMPPVPMPLPGPEPVVPGVVMPANPEADRQTRMDLGKVVSDRQVLLRREQDSKSWRRVTDRGMVRSQDHLMALPGYAVEVRLNRGPGLTLWGNLPEASNNQTVQESEIVLLPPGAGVAGELELLEGRVYLGGDNQGPATWRIRFREQTWDVVVDGQSEVLFEMTPMPAGRATWRLGEEPIALALVAAVKGKAALKPQPGVEWKLEAAPGRQVYALWNSARGIPQGPFPLEATEPLWGREWLGPQDVQGVFRASLAELERELVAERIPAVGMDLALNAKSATPSLRHAALFALGCMGDYTRLLMDMADETLSEDRRQAAAGALRHWVSEEAKRGLELHNPQSDGGILVDRFRLTARDASILVDLLHPPSADEMQDKGHLLEVAGLLQHEQLIVRVAAKRFLEDLAESPSVGHSLVRFDCRGLPASRRAASASWQKLIVEGRVPAPPGLAGKAREGKPPAKQTGSPPKAPAVGK